MALNADDLAEALLVFIEQEYGAITQNRDVAVDYYTGLSTVFIDYLKANADILPGSFANAGGLVGGIGKIQ